MKRKVVLIFHLILVVFGFIGEAVAQDSETIPDKLVLKLNEANSDADSSVYPWKYHPGDNPEWASPTFDDTEWESIFTLGTLLPQDKSSDSEWDGIGWFRLHVSVPDKQLWDTPLALWMIYHAGASEIYLDGELIYEFGTVGTRKEEEKPYWERDPLVISFSGKTDYVIAVRYSNFTSSQSIPVRGFWLVVAPLNESIKGRVNTLRHGTTLQMVWTAISVFLMLQHLLLFFFYPRARENLYFAISTGSIGAFIFLTFQFILWATSSTHILLLLRLLACVYVLMFMSGMLFLYTLFYPKLPKLFWPFLTGWIITICLSMFDSGVGFAILLILLFTGLTFLEMIRVIIVAVFKKKDGAWIFGIGSIAPFVLPFILGVFLSQTKFAINWQLGVLSIILIPLFSMSVYLARNVSRTRRKLETEELERQLLEVENTRKTEELEEARELQMSMLPDAPPELPNLDVAFEMRPATEVGGDYYDFNLTDDGQLTIAIGDATGHGMNAGLVVSAVKSLFKTSAPGAGNLATLERISQGIKSMNFKRLHMAMTLATFNDNKLTLASAGMPPTLIYRSEDDMVEEILLEGMPLGGVIGTKRQEISFELQPGDTVLMMSDGLPEMLNPENEMLDYPKTKELFTQVADKSPKAIIRHMFEASSSWAKGKPQEDDITLVVIKAK
ncbi:SpoIIE family protein phosphatase [Candidatus Poribacteria bacterium]|nr:SpoIIE family protein phosphatase [Candidatus Poribacteria bacterium]MYF54520.1 SpoIIE family protein phosphatase [Candidatus Poribacteria bacterium]